MLSLFMIQLGESLLAEFFQVSESVSYNMRLGIGGVFLIAAAWVLRKDFRSLLTVMREGLRASWAELETEETVSQ
jgi:hypothetical protein